jgi:capsular polysaccharide biosynthesis protein
MVVSVVAGVIVFALLIGAGIAIAQQATTQWIARSSALVLPSKPVSPDQLPGYYETLSRGQIVTTLAELVRLGEFQTEVADQLGLSEAQRKIVDLDVNVVADTAMLQVIATSEDPNLAVAMVDGVVEASTTYIGDLVLPYALVPVSKGSSNLTESGMSTAMVIGIFSLVALVAGLAVQQGVLHLARLNERRRTGRRTPSQTDPPLPDPPSAKHSPPKQRSTTEAATADAAGTKASRAKASDGKAAGAKAQDDTKAPGKKAPGAKASGATKP